MRANQLNRFWIVIPFSAGLLCSQENSIVVTGTPRPVPLAEIDRDVSVLPLPAKERPLYNSWFDLLQLDPALDLRARAPGGFQGDLSIRGATFGQTLVLLNGMRLNDAQTGHFHLDVPLPIEVISSVEVLKGSGSTLYGSDAIGGVVNVRTEPAGSPELRLLGGLGNFGLNQEHAVTSFGKGWWWQQLAFARDFSSGFMTDRDYRNLALSSQSLLKTRLGATSLLFAYSDRPFGANQFYGAASWERTKAWFASAQQDLGENTQVSLAFRRHTDLFVYLRDNPGYFPTNRHIDDSWQGTVRRHDKLPRNGVISYGLEGLTDSVNSTNLGLHRRKRGSGYAFYDLRSVKRFSFSAGLREEVYGWGAVATSPSVSGAAWLSSRMKLRASASRAFRLPSFTDLYYHDPMNRGNADLKPESATSYEGGADLFVRTNLRASLTVFQRRDTNVVDFVRASDIDPWQAKNFNKLRFTGIEASATYEPVAGQHLSLSFSALHGVNASPALLRSKYTFNFPVHSGVFEWHGTPGRGSLANKVIARTRVGVVDRIARTPYAIWDASAGYAAGRVRPFVQLTNITSTVYQDLPGIAMPKAGVVGGIEFYLFGRDK